jgi:hypothetical protein
MIISRHYGKRRKLNFGKVETRDRLDRILLADPLTSWLAVAGPSAGRLNLF